MACVLSACGEREYGVRGTIVRPDGAPVAGATVWMRPACDSEDEYSRASSQGDGSYRVAFLGNLWPNHTPERGIEFAKEGFERRCVKWRIGPGDSAEPLRIEMRPAPAK